MKQKISVSSLVSIAAMSALMSCSLPVHADDDVKKPARVVLDSSRLGPGLLEVAKLVQSGVEETVVLAFIQSRTLQRSPTADELIHLHGIGLSSKGMVALIQSVKEPAAEAQFMTPSEDVPPARANTARVVSVPAQTTIVSPPVVYTRPSVVYVERPVVDYAPYPRFSFGLELGNRIFGHHIFGHHGGGHHSSGHHGGGHSGGGHHGGRHH